MGVNGLKVFVLNWLFLPHWWHWVKSLFSVETIYLLNFVGWTCVALVPTKWQGFYSNNSKLVLGNIFQDTRESLVKWNTWSIRCKTHFPNYSSRRMFHSETDEQIRKWISKIYSKMEPMHINYKWSVHWKWIEIIFKDKWSKLVEYFQFQLKYCFY